MGLFARWLFAFMLLALTYNPTQWNYVRWCMNNYAQEQPLPVLLGLLLFIWYIIYLRATFRSIGTVGVITVLAVVAALVWVLYDWNMLKANNPDVITWVAILAVSIVLGFGLGWPIVQGMVTGQPYADKAN